MASISTLQASSSSSNPHTYDVFLSFRGEDTRKTFTDHLYANLDANGIHTFRDDEELEKGGDIASDLSRAIEESKIFIIIFSKHYADSKWCLNELVKIIDCKTEKGSVVLPVFYHVEPTDVRKQGGSFKDAFLDHAKDADQEKKKTIETWKDALKTAANLSGYHLQNQSEAEFIQRICEDIVKRLNRTPLDMGYNIVGMDIHLKKLKSLIKVEIDDKVEIDKVLMVGIYGIGGIGKTTIAKAIYNDKSSQFDGSSFLGNVGGKCEDGLLKLQKTLLQNILKRYEPKFKNISQGINEIKQRLRSKRVLIVLDDVDNYMQLENLAGKYGWYGAKSIIIITTKDKHLLEQHEVNVVYEVQKMNHEKSAELFNWWAFKQNTPKTGFESLSDSVVEYTHGLPIALKVLGGFLYEKSINEWESELHKLEKIPNKEVQSVLKVSYDNLDDTCQEIFLDIACFFRGKDKDSVSRILGSYAMMGIKVLNDRCLLTISENKLDMHDLVQQMGQEIVRQECLKEPGNRSRLWDPKDVESVLTRNTGTQAIEGLFVQSSLASQISTNSFTKMNRLRLLKVYYPQFWDRDFEALKNLDFPYFELRYFHFEGYPLESLPTNFHAENLVELNLKYSNIKRLWKGNEILDNLKVIKLSYSKDLVEIPNFSSVPNLEILILEGCKSLESFPSSIRHLKALKHVDLSWCENLANLPKSICNLSSLETLILVGCSNLKDFLEIKDDMENLKILDLNGTGIEKLPSSIGHLKALQHLDLSWCESLRSLPESICNLSSLETLILKRDCFREIKGIEELLSSIGRLKALKHLDLKCCTELVSLPYSICNLSSLKHLNLKCCTKLVSLPDSICNLSSLETLIVTRCSNLKSFPEIKDDMENLKWLDLSFIGIKELPSSIGRLKALKHLNLKCCTELVSLPDSICNLSSLKHLNLKCCTKLVSLPDSICNLSSLETLIVKRCSNLKSFPEINDDMENLKWLDLRETDIEELPSSIGHLKALQFLYLSWCESLRSLPDSIFNLSSLETLGIENCLQLERVEVNLEGSLDLTCCILKQRVIWWDDKVEGVVLNHQVSSLSSLVESCTRDYRGISGDSFRLSAVEVLSVGNLSSIQRRILSDVFRQSSLRIVSLHNCNLMEEGIPSDIWNLSSLEGLSLSYCSLTEGIPSDIGNLSSLADLSLSNCSLTEGIPIGIPSDIWNLSSLVNLSLSNCSLTEGIPSDIGNLSSLENLSLSNCSLTEGIPSDIGNLSSLENLSLSNCTLTEGIPIGIPSDIWNLSSLVNLSLSNCSLTEGIPSDIWNLSSLVNLYLSNCSLTEGEILNRICHISSLKNLSLDRNHFSSIPANIIQLSKLRSLCLNHCLKLLQIPELPPSLRVLDVRDCPCLETLSSPSSLLGLSLFKCFESAIEECDGSFNWNKKVTILMPGNNGIPEWISHKKKGSEIEVELLENWWEDNNFLGFALCSAFEFNEDPCYCELNFHHFYFDYRDGFISEFKYVDVIGFSCSYPCCLNGGESNRVWVAAYYPKVAIDSKYWSNEFRHLKASFYGVKEEECGLHLIYKTNIFNRDSNATNHWPRLLSENTDFNVNRSLDDAENPRNKKSRLL